tara:strand:- start:1666 stop:1839 length:174 start_codon:yes stop_codon:yes gene_type:complete
MMFEEMYNAERSRVLELCEQVGSQEAVIKELIAICNRGEVGQVDLETIIKVYNNGEF